MRTVLVLAGAVAMATAMAAEPGARPAPSRASQAWASAPAPVQAPPATPAPANAAEPGEAPARAAPADNAEARTPATPPAAAAAATPAPARPRAGTVAQGAAGGDRLVLDTTVVTGNSELPRVMYVVPWKSAELGELAGRPSNSLLDEVLEPVDRDVLRRQVSYYLALRPDTGR